MTSLVLMNLTTESTTPIGQGTRQDVVVGVEEVRVVEEELLQLCDVAALGDVADLLLEGVHHVVDGAEADDGVAVTAAPVRPAMLENRLSVVTTKFAWIDKCEVINVKIYY